MVTNVTGLVCVPVVVYDVVELVVVNISCVWQAVDSIQVDVGL